MEHIEAHAHVWMIAHKIEFLTDFCNICEKADIWLVIWVSYCFPLYAHTQIHTHVDHIYLYAPALEVSHHVSALRNLGGSIEAHVGVLPIDHVLLERGDTIM